MLDKCRIDDSQKKLHENSPRSLSRPQLTVGTQQIFVELSEWSC